MCELYAYQLVNEGNTYKAVSYLLCIHKTYKAIEVLQDANMFKEAYALARCKLEPDDRSSSNKCAEKLGKIQYAHGRL